MMQAYAKSQNPAALAFAKWPTYNTAPYISETHGNRFVNNYVNEQGKAYGKFEKSGTMPAGAKMAKNSFIVSPDGKVAIGPLFLMEKMPKGFNAESDDWRYTMIMPDGSTTGITKGVGSESVGFCVTCHKAAEKNDSLFFLPAEYRKKRQ